MNKFLLNSIVLAMLLGSVQFTEAKGWFGNNNRWGNFSSFGNGYDCNDWPEWTPMYWMEEMVGDKPTCDELGYSRGYPYQSSVAYGRGYGVSPYASPYTTPYAFPGSSAYGGASPYAASNPYAAYGARYPRNNLLGLGLGAGSPYSPYSRAGAYPRFPGSSFGNPFSSFSGAQSPFSSFGGSSPWSSFGSPMSMGGLGSPMGGFGSPMSPMSMGTMGMPGMSPFSSFGGGSPFGGSGFRPF